ncbi:hypothetical protein BKA66DRAFT_435834 [Pyrenochaeta sp. MPI-SDFR-AT-0127]|nr:hypothetical protein BKA66DRAFT_435834 [Pyrenochaeta sp. MPI-SDFR-AT-0127]
MEEPLLPVHPPSTPVSDWRRERDVFNLYAAFQDIPRIDNLGCSPDTHSFPSDFVPKPATDASLAAFSQLAAMRLQAQRSMISLLDGQYQYILAEATPNTSLRFDSPLNKNLDILLGNVRIPRNWGLCERVLDPSALEDGDPGIIIIKDLSQSRQHENRSYVKEGPKFRFYAGVPLRSPNGAIVGSMCIFDGPERSGMSADDIQYLQDLAATVMEYLVTYAVKDQHRRGAEGLHGLLSFAEGDSKLKEINDFYGPKDRLRKTQNSEIGTCGSRTFEEAREGAPCPTSAQAPQLRRGVSERRYSAGDLQDKMLPNTTRDLFSRASDIMRRSNDLDGVMFLDASIAGGAFIGGDRSPTPASGKQCQILGFATVDNASINNDTMPTDMIPDEGNFAWLLKQYPHGYSLDCDDAQAVSWTEDGVLPNSPVGPENVDNMDQTGRYVTRQQVEHVLRVKALFPNIKSALFLPLWDYDRNRWFAGCFCWSVRAERNLSGPLELPFLKTFGHSIMQEVAKLDALNTNQTKTTFLSSLSHELRSPLHGILGSIQLMRHTPLDSFQSSMVNSITVCGRTLLETVQHLLDHAERREPGQSYSTKTFPKDNTICIASVPPNLNLAPKKNLSTPFCSIGLVTEEVVETMVLGQARFDVSLSGDEVPGNPVMPSSNSEIARRRTRFIIIDIEDYANLEFSISASSYGRIVMNLLGNALKFTESGHILICLRSDPVDESTASVTLKIKDSGIGIPADFLFNEAFEPFRKRNQHSAGTGVGLNVVKRILEDVGGSIEIFSEPNIGTEVTLNLTLDRSKRFEDAESPHNANLTSLSTLKDRRICILHSKTPDANSFPFISALSSTLQKELNMIVTETNDWDGQDECDIVICPEVSFESLHTIRTAAQRKLPATLFIAMDTIEADTLRCDARITSPDSVVEVMTQPCGPLKLGAVLRQCLKRYDETPMNITRNLDRSSDYSSNLSGAQLVPELAIEPASQLPLAFRPKLDLPVEKTIPVVDFSLPPLEVANDEACAFQSSKPQQILIVDDNAINRKLLSVFMKKRKLAYKEAHDGLQASDIYRDAEISFDLVLMDISMPVMDGMTSTRLIREHENRHNLKPAHIIALTGLTSASAKLEAWSSGVDDFLTKPVDFKKLESLMMAGRGGIGTGFLKEQERNGT